MTDKTNWVHSADKIARDMYVDLAERLEGKKISYEFAGQIFMGLALLYIGEAVDRLAEEVKNAGPMRKL